jgi:uncharacterized LabA/DUF88 family protein
MAISYLFIDGGCLRSTIAEIGQRYAGKALELDYEKLARHFSKVFYYDALPSKHASESDQAFQDRLTAAISFHDKLGALDRFHVYEGDTRRSPSLRKQEQKKIDVMIAVDMLMRSFRGNMDQATLLTGDLDFKPLIDALVANGTIVSLWYPPKNTSKELIASADSRRQLDVQSIYGSIKLGSRSFSIPHASNEPDRGEIGKSLAKLTLDGEQFTLWQTDRHFILDGPDPNVGRRTYYHHDDLDVLLKYAEDVLLLRFPPVVAAKT